MRVLCINAARTKGCMPCAPEVVEGETYTVTGECVSITGIPCYELAETKLRYGKFRFVPTSDIDEREFERDYNKVLIDK